MVYIIYATMSHTNNNFTRWFAQ